YDQVRKYDCGSKGNAAFPDQEKLATTKPLLRDVIAAVEDHIRSFTQYEVDYNIEIKTTPDGDGVYHPDPAEFSDLVYRVLDQYLALNRVVIQSFDLRVLKYWHERYPNVRLAVLVENRNSVQSNLQALGFTPSIYSPHFSLVDRAMVRYLR